LIFGLLAIGVYVAFQWLRFPDLTPDGSFVVGAAVYAKVVISGSPPLIGLVAAMVGGAVAGGCTASINRFVRVPTVVAGLLVSSALYSATWLLLGRPNQYLAPDLTLVGNLTGPGAAWCLVLWVLTCCTSIVALLHVFGCTLWGLRARAIGENPLIAHDLGTSETSYTFLCLSIANAISGLAGALFAQRSFSADINMGVGMTITGLAGMILGLIIAAEHRTIWYVLCCILFGSVLYKAAIFLALEAGMPAESFRIVSAGILLALFPLAGAARSKFLRGLKWN
jgi:putative tryptophan/tyrosine transport system permease protein